MSLLSALFGTQQPQPADTGGLASIIGQQAQPQYGSGLGGFLGRAIGGLTNPTNPISQFGHALTIASGGNLGNALGYMDQQRRQSQDDDLEHISKLLAIQTALHPKPQVVNGGDGAIYSVDPTSGQLTTLHEANPKADPAQLSAFRGLAKEAGLSPGTPAYQQAATRAMSGFQYSPELMDERQANTLAAIDRRVAGQIQAKQTPGASSGGHGGGGITANKRADIIAQAQKAIAAGADPAKVHARIAQLGVQF